MSRSLRELGLGADADERAIKRAYAAKLKTTRPGDDPEGFQRLHEAYQAALDWIRSRDAEAEIDDEIVEGIDAFAQDAPSGAPTRTRSQEALFDRLDAQPGEPAMPSLDAYTDRQASIEAATGLPDEAVRFDPEAFLDDCIASAMRSHEDELLQWLNAQPALWSLAHKTRIAPWLLQRLHQQRPPVPASRFDILAEFFGLFDLHSDYDAYTIQRLRHRLQLAWEIETRQARALAERTAQDGGSMAANLRQAGRILGQLSRPLLWPQALWAGLMPGYPSAVRSFLRRLDFGNLDDLPAAIREDQIAFWDAAGDRTRFSIPRWSVSVARLCAYTLAVAMLFALLSPMTPSTSLYRATPIVDVISASFTAMLIAWLLHLANDAFIRWQALPESAPVRFPWLRTASIPLLGIGTIAVDRWLEYDDIAMVAAATVLFLAVQRYRRRSGHAYGEEIRSNAVRVAFLIVFAALVFASASGFVTPVMVSVAIALWVLDMHKQRAALRN